METAGVTRRTSGLHVEVRPDGGVVRGGLVGAGHVGVVLPQGAVLPAPDAFAVDAAAGDKGEETGREEQVVDLGALGAVTERAWPPVAGEPGALGDVPQVGVGQKRIEGRRVRCVVEVPDDGNVVVARGTGGLVDLGHPDRLAPAPSVVGPLAAEALALEVV